MFAQFLDAMQITDSLRIDSYLNLQAISTSNERLDNSINDFDNSGGVQARYQITDNISATGQIYIYEDEEKRSNDTFKVDTKWLYMDYYLGYDITLRGGKFQFPIFKSSETGTIGYSYTWTETPLSYYGANGYDDFTGAEVLQKYFYDDFEFLLQFSYGVSENELPLGKEESSISGKADSLSAITLKTNHDLFSLNIGYLQTVSKLDNDESSEVDLKMYALEGEVYLDDFTFKAGYINASLSDIFPNELRYYLSLEYNYKNWTPYIYHTKESLFFKDDLTSSSKKGFVTDSIVKKNSIGLRYDINDNMAIKFSYAKEDATRKIKNSADETESNYEYKAVLNVIF